MSMLQVRNVPEETHRTLKARAARAGQSLSDYVLVELARLAAQPTVEELSARIAARGRVELRSDLAAVLAQERAGAPGKAGGESREAV